MERKIQVGILGGTGMVGQHFVKFLQNHPWFELTWAGASARSENKKYRDATSWRLNGTMPEAAAAGGYEAAFGLFEPASGARLVDASLALIKELSS